MKHIVQPVSGPLRVQLLGQVRCDILLDIPEIMLQKVTIACFYMAKTIEGYRYFSRLESTWRKI